MKHFVRILLFLFLMLSSPALLLSQESKTGNEYKPKSGQDGKDVIWVPTPYANVENMLNLAGVTSADFVIDLGSGDGRLVIEAARRGARARGIEYNPDMVELSRRSAEEKRVSARVDFVEGDLFEADLSEATVITMFLLNSLNLKLRPSLLELRPGTRIVSNSFHMGDWEADTIAAGDENCNGYCTALMWIVPAKAEGTWLMNNGVLTLDQKYQMVNGTFTTASEKIRIKNVRLTGDLLEFSYNFENFSGRIKGNIIEGYITSGTRSFKWYGAKVFE